LIIVSACLSGVNCRYDGGHRENRVIRRLVSERKAIPLCPETAGGRPVPREPVEICGGTGVDVIAGKARIKDRAGNDFTDEIIQGVEEILKTIERMGVTAVILKTKSPACGCGSIYDGTFSGTMIKGNGILTDALKARGINVYTEDNFEEILDSL